MFNDITSLGKVFKHIFLVQSEYYGYRQYETVKYINKTFAYIG